MNRKLLELANKAGMEVDQFGMIQGCAEHSLNTLFELIISESINTILNNTDRYRKEYFADLLRKQFEIKD